LTEHVGAAARVLQDLLLVFTSVLFIVDPFAVVPSFLAMTERDTPAMRRVLARRGAWTCAITLIVFAAGGSLIFRLFGITLGAFKIAGGVLIGLNALDMVQARRSQQSETPVEKAEGTMKDDIGIMPLGVPMLAGPGAISTVMVLALGSKGPLTTAGLYVSIALTAFVAFLTLSAASIVERRLGHTGMRILTRLMGLVLCAIAVQFIIDGLRLAGVTGSGGT
jgi:multiple antibiotic resistance protein